MSTRFKRLKSKFSKTGAMSIRWIEQYAADKPKKYFTENISQIAPKRENRGPGQGRDTHPQSTRLRIEPNQCQAGRRQRPPCRRGGSGGAPYADPKRTAARSRVRTARIWLRLAAYPSGSSAATWRGERRRRRRRGTWCSRFFFRARSSGTVREVGGGAGLGRVEERQVFVENYYYY